jgi:hypothetical protein
MSLPRTIQLPGSINAITFEAGMSTTVVGANGAGKTKLAIECERQLGTEAHRISAQRMLAIDPSIDKVSESVARSQLRYGMPNTQSFGGPEGTRRYGRWGNEEPRFILDDAGALLQVLFAEQANTAVAANNALIDGLPTTGQPTIMRLLKKLFERVLPTRELVITADDILVVAVADEWRSEPYSISNMSDGEKAVFYIIGQTLVADARSVIIMDEPEIHVHRSILGRLWDELETARADCAFLVITHDLEFAASRSGKKHVVRSYSPSSGWIIEEVPEADGFSEDLITLILGSRKPILFVEGQSSSLDMAFYRACYPGWTIIPRGSCDSVIHSVITMRANDALTRVHCSGIVDADGHDESDRENLEAHGIKVLPVSEIENLLMLPSVSRAILEMLHFSGQELEDKLSSLKAAIFEDASVDVNVDEVTMRHCRRRVDRRLKLFDFSTSTTVDAFAHEFTTRAADVDIRAIGCEFRNALSAAIADGRLSDLLAIYDRKRPLLNLAASRLCGWRIDAFASWVTRAIQDPDDRRLQAALNQVLPVVE